MKNFTRLLFTGLLVLFFSVVGMAQQEQQVTVTGKTETISRKAIKKVTVKKDKKEKEEAKSDLNKYTKKLSEQLASLKENVAKYHKGEFTGWAVSHRFRSLNGAGSMTIPGEMIFFCDEEFTTCGGYETDKFEDFVKILNAVDEATSDEDVIDYFKENNFLL